MHKRLLFSVFLLLATLRCFAADNNASGSRLTDKQREAKRIADLCNAASRISRERGEPASVSPQASNEGKALSLLLEGMSIVSNLQRNNSVNKNSK